MQMIDTKNTARRQWSLVEIFRVETPQTGRPIIIYVRIHHTCTYTYLFFFFL